MSSRSTIFQQLSKRDVRSHLLHPGPVRRPAGVHGGDSQGSDARLDHQDLLLPPLHQRPAHQGHTRPRQGAQGILDS